jgi:hypothetical protein
MNRKIKYFVALLALAPCFSKGDVGTPLVWASAFHMLFGNAILGLLEGWFLAKVFNLRKRRCIFLLILANYFSAWLGIYLVDVLRILQTIDIYNALQVSIMLIIVTYIFTLILEWPFIAVAFGRTPHWISRSLKASILVQTLSYILLFSGYWFVSGNDLYEDFTLVPASEISLPQNVSVYFISSADGNVYRRSHMHYSEMIAKLGSTNISDFLQFQSSKTNPNVWDLVAVLDRWYGPDHIIIVSKDIITNPTEYVLFTQQYWGWGTAPQIGAATNSTWEFSWGHWPTVGLYGYDRKTKQNIQVNFGNPLIRWQMWRAIHLPDDRVLFQIGSDQLCLLDIEKRRIGLWDRGHGPVAIETDKILSNKILQQTAPDE